MSGLSRTLFRELMRTGRRIESCTRPSNAARVSSRLDRFVDGSMQGADSPRHRVRDAFRGASDGTDGIDAAFAALRCAHKTLAWLEPNSRLHELAAASAPTEDGAAVIGELLAEPGTAPPQLAVVRAELDRLADEAKTLMEASGPSPTRLHKLACLNAAIFRDAGFTGEFDPVKLNSSLGSVLARRRGLPILLCTIYQAVAARAGVPLSFTNFPQRILLRLEPQPAPGEWGGGGEEGAAITALSALRLAELKQRLVARGLPTAGRKRALAERLAAVLAEDDAQADAAARPAAGPIAPEALCGLWMADYGAHGPEVVEVVIHRDGPDASLRATKLTGDPHVPAGELTWRASLPAGAEAVALGASLPASLQVAEEGHVNPRMVDGSLKVSDGGALLLGLGGDTMAFSRAHARGLWFIDPWCRGALLPPAACYAALRHLGLGDAADTRAEWTGGIRPPRVWARMLRNLQSREPPGSDAARFWEDTAFGLEALGR